MDKTLLVAKTLCVMSVFDGPKSGEAFVQPTVHFMVATYVFAVCVPCLFI